MISILQKLIGEYQKKLLIQHVQNKKHADVWVNNFTILNSNNRFKINGKVGESLYIRS